MPTSSFKKVGQVLGVLSHIKPPKTVLDIGVGFGKYGMLLREHLDIRKLRYAKSDWTTTIDGVEIWPEYITPIHRFIYDDLILGDIRELVYELDPYDLVVMSDVLEHLDKNEGRTLLLILRAKGCKAIVCSYPKLIGSHWRLWDNPHEEHRTIWTAEEFEELFPGHVVKNGTQVVYILEELADEG